MEVLAKKFKKQTRLSVPSLKTSACRFYSCSQSYKALTWPNGMIVNRQRCHRSKSHKERDTHDHMDERGWTLSRLKGHTRSLMKLVSRCTMRMRRKDISLRVFSNMTRGSSDWQRRQLGAITMARLFTSILVLLTFTGCAKT